MSATDARRTEEGKEPSPTDGGAGAEEEEQMLPLHPEHPDAPESARSPSRPLRRRSSRASGSASASAAAERVAVAALWAVVGSHTIGWDRRLRWANTLLAVLGLANFVVVLSMYQACWDAETLRFDLDPSSCAAFLTLRTLAHVAWAAFIVALCHYYYLKATFQSLSAHYASKRAAFLSSPLASAFAVELSLSLVQPFPLLYILLDLHTSHYLVILALLAKAYLLIRLLRDWSQVYRERTNIKQKSRFDTNFYVMDYLTVMKTYAYYYTAQVVGIGVALNLLLMAYIMHICERELWLPRDAHTGLTPARFDDIPGARLQIPHHGEPILLDAAGNGYFQSPYVSLLNAFYFIGIVSTTTGLGDVAPVTSQGKIFAVMAAFMGMSWSIFAGGILTNKLVPSDFQAYCIDYLERQKIERAKEALAATLIQRSWRLYRSLKLAEARGSAPLSSVERVSKFRSTLLPVLRKFQDVQREEASTQWIFSDHTGVIAKGGSRPKGMPDVAVAQRDREKQIDDWNRIDPGRMGNAALARATELSTLSSPTSSSPASPLTRHARRQSGYGSTEQHHGHGEREGLRQRVQRSSSTSSVMRTPRSEATMSPRNAMRALRNLSRAASVSSASGQGGGGGGGSGSGSRARSPPLLSSGYSSHSSALASLSAQNAALSSSVRALESKLDQLLTAASRAGVHENMLERGHVFTSWTCDSDASDDGSDDDEDAVSAPMLLWIERDGTKYGSLHWTTEEFAVNSRLRIKSPGNSFPLHSITDVLLGKASREFKMPSTASLPSSHCFSVLSKAHPTGLRLQTQYAEERSEWIRQLKQAFIKRSLAPLPAAAASTAVPAPPASLSTSGGSSSTSHSASASPRASSGSLLGLGRADPLSAPVSAKKMRRASDTSGLGLGTSVVSGGSAAGVGVGGGAGAGGSAVGGVGIGPHPSGHSRAPSFMPTFSTPADTPSPSPLARFKSDSQE